MTDTNVRRRADVLRADSRDVLDLLERWPATPCTGCTLTPPAAPAVLQPCGTCRGWRL